MAFIDTFGVRGNFLLVYEVKKVKNHWFRPTEPSLMYRVIETIFPTGIKNQRNEEKIIIWQYWTFNNCLQLGGSSLTFISLQLMNSTENECKTGFFLTCKCN